jgi:aspartyl protease family protein
VLAVGTNGLIGTVAICAVVGIGAPFVLPDLLRGAITPPNVGRTAALAPAPVPSSPARSRGNDDAPQYVSGARTVALRADPYGQFEANAVINGVSLPVIVDTGATTVALSSETARRLGIAPPQSAYRLPVSTANGTLAAAPVMLDEVRVGGISVQNVQAVIIPGNVLSVSLLGMTFLSRLHQFEVAGGQLTLHQ